MPMLTSTDANVGIDQNFQSSDPWFLSDRGWHRRRHRHRHRHWVWAPGRSKHGFGSVNVVKIIKNWKKKMFFGNIWSYRLDTRHFGHSADTLKIIITKLTSKNFNFKIGCFDLITIRFLLYLFKNKEKKLSGHQLRKR